MTKATKEEVDLAVSLLERFGFTMDPRNREVIRIVCDAIVDLREDKVLQKVNKGSRVDAWLVGTRNGEPARDKVRAKLTRAKGTPTVRMEVDVAINVSHVEVHFLMPGFPRAVMIKEWAGLAEPGVAFEIHFEDW